jgi:hypothetical protein
VKVIEQKIAEATKEIAMLDQQINGYSKQLIHKLASKQSDKEILNQVLSSEFTSLPSDLIDKTIKTITSSMALFDGSIRLPENMKGKAIASIDELSEKKTIRERELKEYEPLLPIARDYEKAKSDLADIVKQIDEIKGRIHAIESLPLLRANLIIQKDEFASISEIKGKLEKQLSLLVEDINSKTASIPLLNEAKTKLNTRVNELKAWKLEVEKIFLEPAQCDSLETLNLIYGKLLSVQNDRNQIKGNKDKSFENLKQKVKSQEADEDAFIKYIEDEIACLSDKQKSVATILQAISTQFANPAHLLVKRYEEFKEFIVNKFNTKLSKTKISDIESVKIVLNDSSRTIDDLKRISSIQEIAPQISFDFDHSENLKTLNSYLDSGKKIEFGELFDIELHLTKGGKEKRVDLKEQVESTGTDIMIRMVIIASVINKLAINDSGNKVPIAIDEIARVDGTNRLELFRFCKEHNLIPVCTSTEETMLDGFEKYIMLFRPPSKGKINISEGSPNVIKLETIEA